METTTMPVQSRKVSGRKRWNVEQKLAVLREWKEGLSLRFTPSGSSLNCARDKSGLVSLAKGRLGLGCKIAIKSEGKTEGGYL